MASLPSWADGLNSSIANRAAYERSDTSRHAEAQTAAQRRTDAMRTAEIDFDGLLGRLNTAALASKALERHAEEADILMHMAKLLGHVK